ncbi:hypothetical protein PC116_g1260 [Phytophthora cactorum]|uniref:Uncharacterized protein n=1 Tax=Phytophthora cactorum TaxID=29920 RepID=A0A8T1LQ72_9STRA|nr:hypothetical protein PC114_g10106 [Phytophthora cactorum]KAG2954663.1 hypothetical protein PC117_g1063 [Phytophthora cactorum]KAG4251093.1 hypothetical protein PC116_g1260 [Phytophthora cactorum]
MLYTKTTNGVLNQGPLSLSWSHLLPKSKAVFGAQPQAEWKRLHERLIVIFESILIFMWAR